MVHFIIINHSSMIHTNKVFAAIQHERNLN